MTKTKSTKRALLMSGLALLMCVSMLVGSTFAWFTDSVTSAGNKIVAGTLDIQLLMDADVDGTYDDISDSTSPIFGSSSLIAQNNNADTLWEPGKTQVAYLAIKNNGNLDLKYTVGLNVQNVSKDLYEVMEYAIVPDADANNKVTAWTGGNSVVVGTQSVSGDVELKVGATHYFALAIHMDEEAGNKYQGGEVNFDLTVLATQLNSEKDAFGPNYDKDATFGTYIELDAGDNLLAAMASAEKGMPLTIKLNGDVEWPTEGHNGENDITPASSIVIDGNGYTITATGSGVTPLGDQTAPMTLKNVTIADKSVSYAESAWEFSYLEMGGEVLNCVNVEFVDPIMVESNSAYFEDCSFVGYEDTVNSIKMNGVWMYNGDTTFTNCTFTGTRGMKICDMYSGGEIGTVVIDDCTFMGLTQKPGVAIDDEDTQDMKITIKNSTFINCQPGDQGLYVYETDNTVPTVENNIVESYTELVDIVTKDQLVAFANRVNGGDDMSGVLITLTNNIDLAGIEWTPIGTGANPFNGTFDGNGKTISNVVLNQEDNDESSLVNKDGDYGYAYGFFGVIGWQTGEHANEKVTIKNLNLDVSYETDEAYVLGGLIGADAAAHKGSGRNSSLACDIELSNITVNGKVISKNDKSGATVGGIAGKLYTKGNIVIDGCTNNAEVSASQTPAGKDNKVGGILGFYSGANSAVITNNTNNGNVTSQSAREAGSKASGICITGATTASVNISNNTNNGDITGTANAVAAIAFSGNDKPICMVPQHTTKNNSNSGKLYTLNYQTFDKTDVLYTFLVYGGKSQTPADNTTDDSNYTGGVVVMEINEIVAD